MLLGKERAFNRWVQEHYRFLLRVGWALTGSRHVAEELVQDTFELAWRHQKQLRQAASAKAWLYQILRREALQHIRAGPAPVSWEDEHDNLRQTDPAVLDLRIDMLRALQQLSAAHRDILVLFYLQDMSYRDMADALEIPQGTVMSRLARARTELQKLMKGTIES